MAYFLSQPGAAEDFYGRPLPSVGARVVFDFDRLMAVRARMGLSADRTETAEDGLVIFAEPFEEPMLPDRLWRVDNLEGAVEVDPAAGWLRAKAVTIREELPAWLVMGPRGADVAKVIEQARSLTDEQARRIAAVRAPMGTSELVEAMWNRWVTSKGSGSPVGCGLSQVHHAIEQAARRTGSHLFRWDAVDEVEVIGDPAWIEAGRAANHAALGVGAPELFGPEASERLVRRWRTVMG